MPEELTTTNKAAPKRYYTCPPFLTRLFELLHDKQAGHSYARAAFSHLTFGYAAGEDAEIMRVMGNTLGGEIGRDNTDHHFRQRLIVSGLFATYPETVASVESEFSFGASCRRLRAAMGDVGVDSLDLRFGALLDAPLDDAHELLEAIISQCSATKYDITVDYISLYHNLCRWNSEEPQKRWAKDFWVYSDSEMKKESQQESTEQITE